MAAVCKIDPETLSAVFYVRKFTSTNSDVRQMVDWLKGYGVQDVCMESTGKYWIPVYDILEQNGMKPVLTHPKYVKQAKGQKTDFRDAIHASKLPGKKSLTAYMVMNLSAYNATSWKSSKCILAVSMNASA